MKSALLMPLALVGAVSLEGVAHASVPAFDHIFIIMMENHSYSSIIGNTTDAPYINGLANQYAVAANYFAASHPSLPNYLALTGGDTFGITSDCNTCFVGMPNIAADRVESSGRTWKSYMESMPSACFSGDSSPYFQKHDPLFYYNDIRTVPAECNRIVPYTALATDLGSASTTPNYVFISPNQCNDMHDSCSPLNNPVRQGDNWLSTNLPTILNSPAYTTQSTLVIIVWDEDDSSGNNQVPAIFVAKSAKPGFKSSTQYSHYSLLKTVESAWGLSTLTSNDAAASAMSDLLSAAPPPVPAAPPWNNALLAGLLGTLGLAFFSRRRDPRDAKSTPSP
jgi:acid phosphatase